LAGIIEKRRTLHQQVTLQKQHSKNLESQVSELQSLANMGTTTFMIAHEINNLLAPLSSYAQLALQNLDDKPLTKKSLEKTVKNCQRAAKVMESMLAVGNSPNQDKENSCLLGLIEEVFSCLCRDFSKDGITVNIKISETLEVWAIPAQIQQVLMNLIINARDAMMTGGGTLTIKANQTTETIEIEVRDTGCGVEPENLQNIFEPFFTTKTDKKSPTASCGAGLGLVFCKRIVDEHNGSIEVLSKPNAGTTFKIILPKCKHKA